jgi:hypothetical protein
MYSPSQLAKGIRYPTKALAEVRRILRPAYLRYADRARADRVLDFMEADWDTLVILDACRYDLFADVNTLDGDLRRVASLGTGTDEFLKRNVDGKTFSDTVYLTANPHLHFQRAEFHDVVRLWQHDWDDDLDTVRPEVVTDRALEAYRQYPHKRHVVHFVQPHYPFIGETGRELIESELAIRGFLQDHKSIFHHLEEGTVDHEVVWTAYRENLELTLPHVRRLREELPGRTVVTSDHGNAFGEWGVYGHGGPHIPALVDVPWLTPRNDVERRRLVAGDPDELVSTFDLSVVEGGGTIEDRLADLGYL